MPAWSCQNKCHIFQKVDVSFGEKNTLMFWHYRKAQHALPLICFVREAQYHGNDKDIQIRSVEKASRLCSWQHCCVGLAVEWKKKGFRAEVAILLSSLLLCNALCLGRQALKRLLFGSGSAWFIDIFFMEGTHWIDSFCNFLPLHHCTFLFTMPQPLCSDCCLGSSTGWGKAEEAARWNRTEKGNPIHLFQKRCHRLPQS